MRKISFYKTAFAFALISFFASCAKDDTTGTGDDRDQFVGSWTCSENGTRFGHNTYTVTISKIGDVDKVGIKNFYGLGSSLQAEAYVSGSSLTLFNQNVDGFTLNGTGTLASGKVNLNYTAKEGNQTDTLTATYSQ